MLFDYWIVVISPKLAEIANVEVWQQIKNSNFEIFRFQNLDRKFSFSEFQAKFGFRRKFQIALFPRVLKIWTSCKHIKYCFDDVISDGARQIFARALERAPNVRAASHTQKNGQKYDLWSDSHGARRARKYAHAKKIRIWILDVQ